MQLTRLRSCRRPCPPSDIGVAVEFEDEEEDEEEEEMREIVVGGGGAGQGRAGRAWCGAWRTPQPPRVPGLRSPAAACHAWSEAWFTLPSCPVLHRCQDDDEEEEGEEEERGGVRTGGADVDAGEEAGDDGIPVQVRPRAGWGSSGPRAPPVQASADVVGRWGRSARPLARSHRVHPTAPSRPPPLHLPVRRRLTRTGCSAA